MTKLMIKIAIQWIRTNQKILECKGPIDWLIPYKRARRRNNHPPTPVTVKIMKNCHLGRSTASSPWHRIFSGHWPRLQKPHVVRPRTALSLAWRRIFYLLHCTPHRLLSPIFSFFRLEIEVGATYDCAARGRLSRGGLSREKIFAFLGETEGERGRVCIYGYVARGEIGGIMFESRSCEFIWANSTLPFVDWNFKLWNV